MRDVERKSEPDGRRDRGGYGLATAAMLVVGSSVAASSLIVDYPILTGQAIRYAIGAVILVAIARRTLVRPGRRELVILTALAGLGLVGFNVFLLAALREADPALVGVVIGAVPIVLALVGPVMSGQRPERRIVGAAVLVTAGVIIVQWDESESTLLGLVLALGAMGCEAAFSLLAIPVLGRLRPIGVATYTSALAVPLLVVLALSFESSDIALPAAAEIVALVYLGAVVTAAAFLAWYSAIARVGVARAGLFAGLVPIAALGASAAIGTSEVTFFRLLGALVVFAAILIGVGQGNRRSAP